MSQIVFFVIFPKTNLPDPESLQVRTAFDTEDSVRRDILCEDNFPLQTVYKFSILEAIRNSFFTIYNLSFLMDIVRRSLVSLVCSLVIAYAVYLLTIGATVVSPEYVGMNFIGILMLIAIA